MQINNKGKKLLTYGFKLYMDVCRFVSSYPHWLFRALNGRQTKLKGS